MKIHRWKQWDVEQHCSEDEEGETEGDVEDVGQRHRERLVGVSVKETLVHAEQLPRHPHRVGNDEERVPAHQPASAY